VVAEAASLQHVVDFSTAAEGDTRYEHGRWRLLNTSSLGLSMQASEG
jgi:hypothetical protein